MKRTELLLALREHRRLSLALILSFEAAFYDMLRLSLSGAAQAKKALVESFFFNIGRLLNGGRALFSFLFLSTAARGSFKANEKAGNGDTRPRSVSLLARCRRRVARSNHLPSRPSAPNQLQACLKCQSGKGALARPTLELSNFVRRTVSVSLSVKSATPTSKFRIHLIRPMFA